MKYLMIETQGDNGYIVRTKKKEEFLGMIYLYKPWKKWVFEPSAGTVYDSECMKDLISFMEEELKIK